jgi:aspartate/methionine/tyrosine aminotransferase
LDIKLSPCVQRIKSSPTLAITTLANQLRAEGRDVIGLGAGEPDFDTPEHIKQAAIEAMRTGQTTYTPVDGTASLERAVIEKFKMCTAFEERHRFVVDRLNQIEGIDCLASDGTFYSFPNVHKALDRIITAVNP